MREVKRALGVAVSCMLAATPARADEHQACVDAFVAGQVARKAGKLREARAHFALCSQETCPAVTARDCGRWREEVDAQIPTLVFDARDSDGRVVTNVRVKMDGAALVSQLDGRAVAADPGPHVFTFEIAGEPPREQRVVVYEGAKAQRVAVALPSHEPAHSVLPSPRGYERPIPIAAYVLGGVGVLGLASFTYFGVSGASRENELRGSCAPACPESDRDGVRARYVVADISLGIGVASLITAGWMFFTRPSVEVRPAAARPSLSRAPGGGWVATLGGSF